ncbi:hypothetical protein DIPPA_13286 [Diplonema papillatum]|nr:hypothetical protein DIPPA_13286 [Diplonema papillatum]
MNMNDQRTSTAPSDPPAGNSERCRSAGGARPAEAARRVPAAASSCAGVSAGARRNGSRVSLAESEHVKRPSDEASSTTQPDDARRRQSDGAARPRTDDALRCASSRVSLAESGYVKLPSDGASSLQLDDARRCTSSRVSLAEGSHTKRPSDGASSLQLDDARRCTSSRVSLAEGCHTKRPSDEASSLQLDDDRQCTSSRVSLAEGSHTKRPSDGAWRLQLDDARRCTSSRASLAERGHINRPSDGATSLRTDDTTRRGHARASPPGTHERALSGLSPAFKTDARSDDRILADAAKTRAGMPPPFTDGDLNCISYLAPPPPHLTPLDHRDSTVVDSLDAFIRHPAGKRRPFVRNALKQSLSRLCASDVGSCTPSLIGKGISRFVAGGFHPRYVCCAREDLPKQTEQRDFITSFNRAFRLRTTNDPDDEDNIMKTRARCFRRKIPPHLLLI